MNSCTLLNAIFSDDISNRSQSTNGNKTDLLSTICKSTHTYIGGDILRYSAPYGLHAMNHPKSPFGKPLIPPCSGVSALNPGDSRRHGEFVELTYSYTQDPKEFKYRKIRYSHAGFSFRWRARPANASAMVSNTLDDEHLSLQHE